MNKEKFIICGIMDPLVISFIILPPKNLFNKKHSTFYSKFLLFARLKKELYKNIK